MAGILSIKSKTYKNFKKNCKELKNKKRKVSYLMFFVKDFPFIVYFFDC